MSCTLAIETATRRGGVAVVRDGAVVFARHFVSERSHNSRLFAPLGEALKIAGDGLRRIVVGLGPGSYTGARVGIAAVQGIALSRQVPVIGLPSVLAPETEEPPGDFVVCGDARRGAFFIAQIQGGVLAEEITLHGSDDLLRLRGGDARRKWFTFDPKPPQDLVAVIATSPSASRLALIAGAMTDESVWTLEQRVLEPVYLAAPFVTKARARGS